jgi:hypothetical protein
LKIFGKNVIITVAIENYQLRGAKMKQLGFFESSFAYGRLDKCTDPLLNLDSPRTFNEKIQWLKLYDSTPLKTRLADKYLARDWIKEEFIRKSVISSLR